MTFPFFMHTGLAFLLKYRLKLMLSGLPSPYVLPKSPRQTNKQTINQQQQNPTLYLIYHRATNTEHL